MCFFSFILNGLIGYGAHPMRKQCGLVFVGRDNSAKGSDTFQQISEKLSQQGRSVYWFQSPHPGGSVECAQELDGFINGLPVKQVHFITHSAGGIAATKISAHRKVSSICCFGYPFKHPDHPVESYRIEHLGAVAKPLLIIQGNSDEYGSDPAYIASMLPQAAQIVSVECTHDYDHLSEAEFEKAWTALQNLIASQSGAIDRWRVDQIAALAKALLTRAKRPRARWLNGLFCQA